MVCVRITYITKANNFYLQIIEFTVTINRIKTTKSFVVKIGVRNDKLFLSTFLQYMKCIKMCHKKLPK